MELPIVSDTFYVFPHSMTENFIEAIINMETNPPHGVNVAMHNMYLPMCELVGKENVKWVCDKFYSSLKSKFIAFILQLITGIKNIKVKAA